MEAETALVRTDGRVELNSVAAVYLYLAGIVNPGDTEAYETLRVCHAAEDIVFDKLGALLDNLLKRSENLFYCLNKLGFFTVAGFNTRDYISDIFVHKLHYPSCKNMGKIYSFKAIKSIDLQVLFFKLANFVVLPAKFRTNIRFLFVFSTILYGQYSIICHFKEKKVCCIIDCAF